jgi:hypothetical protein
MYKSYFESQTARLRLRDLESDNEKGSSAKFWMWRDNSLIKIRKCFMRANICKICGVISYSGDHYKLNPT